MKFLSTILILFFFEFAMGQIPGTPSLFSTNQIPRVYTHSVTSPNLSLITANVSAQIINTAQNPIIESGVLWGSGIPTIASNLGKSTDGIITGVPFTSIANPLPLDKDSINFVAYATTNNGKTYYGKVLTIYRTVTSPFTGRIWMMHNLGASAMPKDPQLNGDTASYGNLYQWGRRSDGHQIIHPLKSATYSSGIPTNGTANSLVTTTQASNSSGGGTSFINSSGDWLSTANNTLWQGVNGTNNPCPANFRVPTAAEFLLETINFSSQNASGAFNSFLKLPHTGFRNTTGVLNLPGGYFTYNSGNYWTSTIGSGTTSAYVNFSSTGTSISTSNTLPRSHGFAVRCIKGELSSGGSAVITNFTNVSPSGTMTASVAVSEVKQTISATVATTGTYNISTAPINGVIFSGSGTFSATGAQNIVLTASGIPLVATAPPSSISYAINTTPSLTFTRTVQGWTTNGTAVVSSYTRISSTPTIFFEDPITQLSETFSAVVTTPGSYNLTAVNNGVTFIASGTFTQTGTQNIVFNYSSGSFLNTGTISYSSNTTPVATFSIYILSRTTNGTARITQYKGNSTFGSFVAGTPTTSANYQNISADIIAGTYSITSTAVNGVTFSGNGNSSGGSPTNISLFASGTPEFRGTYTFGTNTTPNLAFNVTMGGEVSTNGTAIISSVSLGGSTGTITHPVEASGNSQTITVNVTKLGTYNISAVAFGVTYSAIGTFTVLGLQDITLNASGIPNTTGTYNFTTNTTPNVSFSRYVISQSSNGLAIFTSWSPVSSFGNLYAGGTENGANRQTIRAASTLGGPYTISTSTVNGITFSAPTNGTGGANPFTLELTASGTPINTGTFDYTLNTTPSFTFSRTVSIADPSSNGTATISSINFNSQGGTYMSGLPLAPPLTVFWVRYNVNASKAGYYNISSLFNGLTFNGYGNIPTGASVIELIGQGTPTTSGNFNPVLNVTNVTGSSNYTVTVSANTSTNGDGVISTINSYTPNGTMIRGIPLSLTGVTQTINATVTRVGSYNLATVATNGVTFTGSGTFTQTGNQDFVLTGSGAPTVTGPYTFRRFPDYNVSFSRTTVAPTGNVNGTAVVSEFNSISSAGTMTAGVPVSDVTQTFTANVTTPGVYNITTTTSNGVTFSGAGKFDNVGIQEFTLTASGTPLSNEAGPNFTLTTTPSASFNRTYELNPTSNGTAVISALNLESTVGTMTVGVPVSGVTQAIGFNASKTGTINMSATSNGVTFAWSTTASNTGPNSIILRASGTPTNTGSSNFITNTTPSFTFARTTLVHPSSNGSAHVSSYTLGASEGRMTRGIPVSGVTQTMTANVTKEGTYSINIPATNGVTFAASGTFSGTGNQDITFIASGTPTAASASTTFASSTTPPVSFTRATGEPSSNGTAVITGYTLVSSAGTMTVGEPVSNVSQTIRVTLSTTAVRTYNISAIANGVTFSASGSTNSGAVGRTFDIVLTATGTPTAAGNISFNSDTNPVMTFTRTINP